MSNTKTDRYDVPSDMLQDWDAEMRYQARNLDLTVQGNRGLLLRRMQGKADATPVPLLIGITRAWGINLSGNTSRANTLRCLVDAWFAKVAPR